MSKTPMTDAIQEAFNKRDGMCVYDIVEAYEHARVLEQVVSKLRAKNNTLWEALNDAATSLETLGRDACKTEELLRSSSIRGYANNRANQARAALTEEKKP